MTFFMLALFNGETVIGFCSLKMLMVLGSKEMLMIFLLWFIIFSFWVFYYANSIVLILS